ncbi:hypothetical protein F4V91_13470 [Neorhizobium galegae]|uniref:Uncharacterized protein n=1 Tax=Neorhizobium galegae TaxID=399 RepID=A0A6A1TRY0_NEOGA|nr:hypothetical protein [Neorhizobium galegae]KAB1087342.1 hypothetical protein F4V91_13470 [Neorhizobium galegae]
MRMMLVAFVAMIGATSAAAADSETWGKEWSVYRLFLNEPACGVAPDVNKCIKVLDRWRRDFMWATDPHWRNPYAGQRNVAICLAEGCDGEVKKNPVLACGWSRVVLLAGHPEIVEEDFQRERTYCGALKTPIEKDTATAQAQRLIRLLSSQ